MRLLNFRRPPRWVRSCNWALLAVIALLLVLWAWVDWSGARHWRQARAMLAREGQPLDFRAVAPDPIPDADNFCAIPILKDIAMVIDNDWKKGEPGEKRARLNAACLPPYDHTGWAPKLTGAALGRRADLKRFAALMRANGWPFVRDDLEDSAHDVLAAFTNHDPLYKELAAGLDRPAAQWTPAWKTRDLPRNLSTLPFPHYGPVNGLNRTLALRCIAAGRAGDLPKAHESAQLMAKLNQACLNEPFIVGLLVSAKGTTALANATWELCDAQAGSAEDFSRLESALVAMDFRRSACLATSSDLIGVVTLLQPANKAPEALAYFSPSLKDNTTGLGMFPSGFWNANTAQYAECDFEYLVKPLRDRGWPAALLSASEVDARLAAMHKQWLTHPDYIVAIILSTAISDVIRQAFYAQTLVNQATVACALERYRIETGSYPDSLALVTLTDGKPLPLDIMTGQPMGYRKTANGKYALWCVSLNGKDHGGTRVLNRRRPESAKIWKDTYAGDWVWDFPEK